MHARIRALAAAGGLLSSGLFLSPLARAETLSDPSLGSPVSVTRDASGIVSIAARSETDLAFAQGWAHARDRLFQMDLLRRTASGTVAEIIPFFPIEEDIQLRTLGLRRAAERSLASLSAEAKAALKAYAAGVNAYKNANQGPPEYRAPGPGAVADWSDLDSVAVGKLAAFQISFSLDDIDRSLALQSYRANRNVPDPLALFFADIFRVAPVEAVASAAASESAPSTSGPASSAPAAPPPALSADGVAAARRLAGIGLGRSGDTGAHSNAFAVAGRSTVSGKPILANDPHFDLTAPPQFYPIHLRSATGFDVSGVSIPGVPFVFQGFNRALAWGFTSSGVDVLDVYQDSLVADRNAPSGFSILHCGRREPVEAEQETYFFVEDGALKESDAVSTTLTVSRRNNGPIISRSGTTALTVQWVGFAPTRDIDAIRLMNLARGRTEFERALRFFDVGSAGLVYADARGTIGYYLTGEIPLREDLERGQPGFPFLVRDGSCGQEWAPLAGLPPPHQALPFAVLPAEEMPRRLNPAAGYIVAANNDPLGDTFDNNAINQLRPNGIGIRYLGADYNPGLRARRLGDLLDQLIDKGKVRNQELQQIQADVVLPDAAFFVPFILRALNNAARSREPALAVFTRNTRLVEAVARLRQWSQAAPTGVSEGFDAADEAGDPSPVTPEEAADSVAATIYSVWRAHMIGNTVDRTLASVGLSAPPPRYAFRALHHLLADFQTNHGVGASGLDFFAVPGVGDAAARRDILILASLAQALDRLAGDDFAPAFGRSTNLDDYRWGKLHRLTIEHAFIDRFGYTVAGGPFPPPFAGLPGVPVDGGFETIDRANHDVRAGSGGGGSSAANDFVFDEGPVYRIVVPVGAQRMPAAFALSGGASGVPGSPHYADLLGRWLTNDAVPLRRGR